MQMTKDDIRKLIESTMENVSLAELVRETLKPFDGKKITKRLATAVSEALPDHTVFYRNEYGTKALEIWGNGIDHRSRKAFTLGHDSEGPEFNHERFSGLDSDGLNGCHYYAAQERNEKRHALLIANGWTSDMASAINDLREASARIDDLIEFPNPMRYVIDQLIKEG